MDGCDVVVPRNKVVTFIKYTHDLEKEFKVRVRMPSFGHARDGNFCVYICKDDIWEEKLNAVFDYMYKKLEGLSQYSILKIF